MNRELRSFLSILVVGIFFYPFSLSARLSLGVTKRMVGSSTASAAVNSDSGNACNDLQQALSYDSSGEMKTPLSGYLSNRDGNFSHKTFTQACSLSWPGQLRGYADLTRGDFSWAIMPSVNLSNAMLNGVDFTGAQLKNSQLSFIDAAFIPVVFKNTNLSGAIIRDAHLENVDMSNVIAKQTSFMGSSLRGAKMIQGNFNKALFLGARIIDVDATGADFREAVFGGGAIFSGNVSGANFTGAVGIESSGFLNLYFKAGNRPIGLPDYVELEELK